MSRTIAPAVPARHPSASRFRPILLLLCAAFGTPVAATDSAPRHETLRIESRQLGETRRINVYLPPGYDHCRSMRYPVLYMPDGGVAEDFPHVTATVDRMIRAHAISPLIVVGVENTVRRRDMTPPTSTASDLEVTTEPGGAARFRAFFGRELMPVVRARYRTTDDTAIIGESLAGLFIVDAWLAEPGLFDTWIALDPSLWWDDGALVRRVADAPPESDGSRLLLVSAGEGNAEVVDAFAAALATHVAPGESWQHTRRHDLRHDNVYREMKRPMLELAFTGRVPAASTTVDGGHAEQGATCALMAD